MRADSCVISKGRNVREEQPVRELLSARSQKIRGASIEFFWGVVRRAKPDKCLRAKADRSGMVGKVEEELRFGLLGWRVAEDGDVAVWMKAMDEARAGRSIHAQTE